MKYTFGLITGALLLSAWMLAPATQSEQMPQVPAIGALEIPNVSIDRPDATLQNGLLFYNDELFSGKVERPAAGIRLKSVTEYFRGKKHGVSETWHPDGTRAEVRYYKAGRKAGVHTGWWPSGNLKFSYTFSDAVYHGDVREWYDSGQPASAYYYEGGRPVGPQKAWRENGKLYINLIYRNGRRYGALRTKLCYRVEDGERKSVGYPDEAY